MQKEGAARIEAAPCFWHAGRRDGRDGRLKRAADDLPAFRDTVDEGAQIRFHTVKFDEKAVVAVVGLEFDVLSPFANSRQGVDKLALLVGRIQDVRAHPVYHDGALHTLQGRLQRAVTRTQVEQIQSPR